MRRGAHSCKYMEISRGYRVQSVTSHQDNSTKHIQWQFGSKITKCGHRMEDSHQRRHSGLWVYPPSVTEVINGLQVKGLLDRTPWEVCSGIPYGDYQMVTVISVIFVIMYGNENSLSASGPTTCLLVLEGCCWWQQGSIDGWWHPLSEQQWFPLMASQTSWTWQGLKEHCQTLQYIVISM